MHAEKFREVIHGRPYRENVVLVDQIDQDVYVTFSGVLTSRHRTEHSRIAQARRLDNRPNLGHMPPQ